VAAGCPASVLTCGKGQNRGKRRGGAHGARAAGWRLERAQAAGFDCGGARTKQWEGMRTLCEAKAKAARVGDVGPGRTTVKGAAWVAVWPSACAPYGPEGSSGRT
jgi:hypothetical protein